MMNAVSPAAIFRTAVERMKKFLEVPRMFDVQAPDGIFGNTKNGPKRFAITETAIGSNLWNVNVELLDTGGNTFLTRKLPELMGWEHMRDMGRELAPYQVITLLKPYVRLDVLKGTVAPNLGLSEAALNKALVL